MTIRNLLTETVTVRRFQAGAQDRYGDTSEGWNAGSQHRARLEQVSESEVTVDRDTQRSDWRLFLEAGVEIGGRDLVVDSGGRTFEVVGPPDVQKTPRGPLFTTARLRHVEG